MPRAPLHASGVTRLRHGVSHHVSGHYPTFITPTSSCVKPNTSHQLRLSLIRQVFAGCRQSLLVDGSSRRYLRNPCMGVGTHAPQRPFSALTCFFLKDFGLTLEERSSARQIPLVLQLQRGGGFRGCSHSFMFQLPYSLDLQVAPTAEARLQGSQALYTTHRTCGYPS